MEWKSSPRSSLLPSTSSPPPSSQYLSATLVIVLLRPTTFTFCKCNLNYVFNFYWEQTFCQSLSVFFFCFYPIKWLTKTKCAFLSKKRAREFLGTESMKVLATWGTSCRGGWSFQGGALKGTACCHCSAEVQGQVCIHTVRQQVCRFTVSSII